MKWIIYIVLFLGAILVPGEATDVGKLIPVEVVAVSEEQGNIILETDTGNRGSGESVDEAVRDLAAHASGVIYLDTAEFLIVEEGLDPRQLCPYLKGNIRVCTGSNIPLRKIADYLTIHKPVYRLKEVANNVRLQQLREEKGGFILL